MFSGSSFSSIFNPIAANYSSYFGFSQVGVTSTPVVQYNSSVDDEIVSF